ncbi:MAG: alpha/beta hydrolase-fold protein [Flavobacteriales bacterium]
MTIQINAAPQLTPLLDDIYIAGTMNNWSEGSEDYKLTHNQDGTWSINIEGTQNETMEFKFTRGSWSKVEGNALGAYIPNRTATFVNGTTTTLSIEGWEDIAGTHTVTEYVRILDTDFAIPQLGRTRRIWICFPQDYFSSDMHYPVCYMHDGQNVFDAATSFAGEWNADETMLTANVPECANAIIVGIDNGGLSRMDEYSPWLNAEYNEGGEGQEFAAFIAETLKPFIDETFRTLPDRIHTSTAGSSLGALISMYMLVEYNNVFSKAGIFSPAFWFNEEIYQFAENNPMSADTRIHFVCGDDESTGMVGDMQQMVDIAQTQGLQVTATVHAGGQHSEYYWSLQFPDCYPDMFDCLLAVQENNLPLLYSFPNPTSDSIQIATRSGAIIHSIQILSDDGSLVKEVPDVNAALVNVSLSGMSFGHYVVKAIFENTTLNQELRIECGFVPVIKN